VTPQIGETVTEYLVTLYGQAREVYIVTAESLEDARERWHEGDLYVSRRHLAASMRVTWTTCTADRTSCATHPCSWP
jgi:hypothetical protein